MPTYQYVCTDCGADLEVVQKFTDPTLTDCPQCAGRLRKVFNAVGVVFKGSGFYRTDSRAGSGEGSGSKESGSDSTKADSTKGDSTKSDSTKSDSTKSGSAGSDGKSSGATSGNGSSSSGSSTGSSGRKSAAAS